MVVATKTFGKTKTTKKATKSSLPVTRVWDTTQLTSAHVETYRHQISVSIIDDEAELAKAFHRAIMKWRELSGQEHFGKVFIETVPTGEIVAGQDGKSALLVHVFIVVETAPEVSAR